MDTSTLFQNGTTWLRADFHLHTKADEEFPYSGDDSYFTSAYINKLVEKNIRVGVITNHNKFNREEFVNLKKNGEKSGIGLFPGVEFSLKEGIHILIVFEDDWYKGYSDHINEFLQTAFYGVPNFDKPPYPNSPFDLTETVEKLDKIGHNYLIILAHVDATNGLNIVLGGRTREAFIQQESFKRKVLAIQKSGNLDHYNTLCQLTKGRKIACVEGSDNAEEGIEGIGKGKATYIKIGDFNFEALQYALLNHENRVHPEDKPQIHNSWIKSVAFEGGLLDGKSVHFSPELNNLIGIRGSGKSSILEILRYALNIPLGSQTIDADYKNGLLSYVLKSGGKVVVELINRHGVLYRVERIYGQKENIYEGDILQPGITLDAILQRPVYFGQKDLSNKDTDFEDDLVNKLIGGRLDDVKKKINVQEQEIQRIVHSLNECVNLSLLKIDTERIKNDAEHRLKLFIEKGVSEKLQKQTNFDSDVYKIQNYISGLDSYIGDIVSLTQNSDHLIKPINFSATNQEVSRLFSQEQESLKLEMNKLIGILSNLTQKRAAFLNILAPLKEKREALKEEFAQIKREIDIPELNPDEFIKINRTLETSKLKLSEIEKSEEKREKLLSNLSEACTKLEALWSDEFAILQQEVEKINNDRTKLSIEISYKGRKEKFRDKLQELCKGSGIRTTVYESMVALYADFIDLWKSNFSELSNLLNENQLVDFKKRFNDNIFDLLTFKVPNQFTIKFEGKPLKDHSLGQRASALILFLLTQKENDILIIDQPEDDLDNQTIYKDVIHEIKKLKGEMQFIFATHNANIPVLGDSEMLVTCQYVNGKEIKLEKGSIDCQPIQKKIINIMEGGKEAFNFRRNIYKIWEVVN